MAVAPSLLRIVRVRDLTQHLHVTRNQLLRLRRADPSFLAPFRLGTGRNGSIAWFEGEINAWLTNRPRAVLPDKPSASLGASPSAI